MKKEIITEKELLEQIQIDPVFLKRLLERKLVKAAGTIDENVAVFDKVTLQQLQEIKQFQAMGYSLDDIEKILKKVGLPSRKQTNDDRTPAMRYLTVGELATRLDINPRTIKYWEERGIIEPDSRSEGGFRLYAEYWVYLCNLISDLQLFGYSLEEIKEISDLFRDFLAIEKSIDAFPYDQTAAKLKSMREKIQAFYEKMKHFKNGIQRWEELLKKKEKEIRLFENKLKQSKAAPDNKEKQA
ncbi:MAG: MerR family transcriptional regulator [candidate division KSB1 bacterium]|nr:MerR family transcriptional regulator [candidate division KSB1 bacterium]MDZ7342458.1 MerR family transcriptional regulator [candidate division KSB1 bacterium]